MNKVPINEIRCWHFWQELLPGSPERWVEILERDIDYHYEQLHDKDQSTIWHAQCIEISQAYREAMRDA